MHQSVCWTVGETCHLSIYQDKKNGAETPEVNRWPARTLLEQQPPPWRPRWLMMHPSNCLVGEAESLPGGGTADPEWRFYLKHLPTKNDIRALIAEVKETCRSKIATMRQDLKMVADRVDS